MDNGLSGGTGGAGGSGGGPGLGNGPSSMSMQGAGRQRLRAGYGGEARGRKLKGAAPRQRPQLHQQQPHQLQPPAGGFGGASNPAMRRGVPPTNGKSLGNNNNNSNNNGSSSSNNNNNNENSSNMSFRFDKQHLPTPQQSNPVPPLAGFQQQQQQQQNGPTPRSSVDVTFPSPGMGIAHGSGHSNATTPKRTVAQLDRGRRSAERAGDPWGGPAGSGGSTASHPTAEGGHRSRRRAPGRLRRRPRKLGSF